MISHGGQQMCDPGLLPVLLAQPIFTKSSIIGKFRINFSMCRLDAYYAGVMHVNMYSKYNHQNPNLNKHGIPGKHKQNNTPYS
jgi:hypothetical protein